MISLPPGAGIARFVTDCYRAFEIEMIAFDIAFPRGGRLKILQKIYFVHPFSTRHAAISFSSEYEAFAALVDGRHTHGMPVFSARYFK